MLFAVQAFDRQGALPVRQANYDAHRAFLNDTQRFGVEIVMSGPLVADDGETPIGSLFVVEAPDRASVEKFHQADPFSSAAVFERSHIVGFIRRR